MPEIHLTVNPRIFNKVYVPLLHDDTPMQIIYGGSSSGKSVFEAQRVILDVADGYRNYLCVRKVKNSIKHSMFNELVKMIGSMKLWLLFRVNYGELLITCTNGCQILFAGLDDVEKIKSITPEKGVLTDIWGEEATEFLENDIRQLRRRLRGKCRVKKRMTLTFNPILISHHLYVSYFNNWDDSKTFYKDSKIVILKTTYKDNLRFLAQEDIDLLENETDPYFRDVYTLGNWGVLGNLIFKNWECRDLMNEMIELEEGRMVPLVKTFDKFINGLDFGFSADPAAALRTHYDKNHKTIYILSEIYMREMTNDILAKEVEQMIGREYIKCDSAEPKSVVELRTMKINAIGARKGKDSVNFGIDWLKRQKIVIDIRCINTKNEFMQYKWKEDKDGNVLKVPVDRNDHAISALRYAYEDEMEGRQVTAVKGF